MSPSARTRLALIILVVFGALVGIGISQVSNGGESERVGEELETVSYNGIAIAVPDGWTAVELSQKQPCPPVQDKTVIIAAPGIGGDCKTSDSKDSQIWLTNLSPVEVAPPTTTEIGNTTGWVQETVDAPFKRWVAAVPETKTQLTFSGLIDDKTREAVLDSVRR